MPQLEVQTREGSVVGKLIVDPAGAPSVRCWKGIAYALPPVGPLRWRAPQPVAVSSRVEAFEFGFDCPQPRFEASRAPGTSEDCLRLNVWAPAEPEESSLPVMVWFHGGGFVGGSGADQRCDGAALARQGVVVVSFNYRVGLFGFLAHPALSAESPHGVSGNYGLMDQLQALRWVRDNIAAFGGDAQRVTAFGVSAGSASISLLLTSPLADGLFQQAILHSPGAGRPLASLQQAEAAGAVLGVDIDALRDMTASDVLSRTALLSAAVRGLTTPRVLRPIRDGHVVREDERSAFAAGRLHRMPLIVGTNADEGSLLTASWPVRDVRAYDELLTANFGASSAEAFRLYPAVVDAQASERTAELFADTQFNYGARLLARTASRLDGRVWRYVFTRRRPGQTDGPHHGDEVAHVFGNLAAGSGEQPVEFDDGDRAVSNAMMHAWLAFARRGEPVAPDLVEWPCYASQMDQHLEFGDAIEVAYGWRAGKLDFLDRFFADRDDADREGGERGAVPPSA